MLLLIPSFRFRPALTIAALAGFAAVSVCGMARAADDVLPPPLPHLVAGGVNLLQGDRPIEVYATRGLSIGTVSPVLLPTAVPPTLANISLPDKLAMGGYMAFTQDSYNLTSILRDRQGTQGADLSASYAGSLLGHSGVAAFTLGYDWQRANAFSPSTRTIGLDSLDGLHSGMSMSLSWNQSITPSLHVGGFAGTIRTQPTLDEPGMSPMNAFRLGAGLGLSF